MKVLAQASSPSCPGSQVKIEPSRPIAASAIVLAAASYCSMRWGGSDATGLVRKPLVDSSSVKELAGDVTSPRRSRTVWLYSDLVSASATLGPASAVTQRPSASSA